MWLGPAAKRAFNPNRFHFNFRWFWDYAGGLMTDWGVHLINMMLMGMGPDAPKSAYSCGGKFVLDDNSETPDSQVTLYEFPNYTLIWEHKSAPRKVKRTLTTSANQAAPTRVPPTCATSWIA
jgi:predicted dehydrogenase